MPPTHALEANGLTATVLQEIVDHINQKARKTTDEHYSPIYTVLMVLPCVCIFIGFALLMLDPFPFGPGSHPLAFGMSIALPIILSASCAMVLMGTCVAAALKSHKAAQIAVDEMRRTVEITLNEQWWQHNVQWTVVAEQTLEFDGQYSRIVTWYNVQVEPTNEILM